MKKVVIDTNVIMSGLIKAESAPIFEEISRIIRHPKVAKYHKMAEEEIEDFLLNLYSATHETEGKIELDIVEDPDDNIFLACAIEGKADYVVTGDKLFLKLKEYEGIEIITPSQFLRKESL